MNKADRKSSPFGSAMMVAAWLILLGMLAIYFNDLYQQQVNPNDKPETSLIDGRQTLVLESNRYNHFVMTGKINGIAVPLLLDTGATQVAVPANMAEHLNLKPGRSVIAGTANGPVEVFTTRIEKLELGGIVLYNVPAQLNPGMNGMGEVLLGMSALSQLEFRQRDGKLELIQ